MHFCSVTPSALYPSGPWSILEGRFPLHFKKHKTYLFKSDYRFQVKIDITQEELLMIDYADLFLWQFVIALRLKRMCITL